MEPTTPSPDFVFTEQRAIVELCASPALDSLNRHSRRKSRAWGQFALLTLLPHSKLSWLCSSLQRPHGMFS